MDENDVVIVAALRTPLQRAKRGLFKDTYPEELLLTVLEGLVKKTGIDPKIVEDVAVGNVLAGGAGATQARMAVLAAGQCSSGLQAVACIAEAIAAGRIDVGIGAGMESMTFHYGPQSMPSGLSEKVLETPSSADCLMPMGITSENVAEKFQVSREDQDNFALRSHEKAIRAKSMGYFNDEIVPVTVKVEGKSVTVIEDDGPRKSTFEMLMKLKPSFKDNGTTTAGNSSQVTDGAAAVLLMNRRMAKKLGLVVLAKWVSFAVVGVPPSLMGIGPAYAIPACLSKAKLTLDAIDIFEINEAFASQCLYCMKKLGIPEQKLNPKGGAIALGHPLGATGARLIATVLPEMKRQKSNYAIISMCVGTGMGAAALIKNEQQSSSKL